VKTLELKNITKVFGSIVANKNVSLTIKSGEILAILGENGSGKTTLMNMIAGIYHPDSGEIYVDGKEASKEAISEKVIKEPVDKIVTYSSQSSSSSQGGSGSSSSGGKTVVSKVPVYDCDGSGHGYYEITYSDGTVEYQEF